MPSFGSIVRVGVVVAAAAASSATSIPCESIDRIESRTLSVSASDPEHRAALEACLAQDARCEDLCDDLLGLPAPGHVRTIRECYLIEQGDGYRVHTTYRITGRCDDGYDLYPDAAWYPEPDATPYHDAAPSPDATPPDAGP